MTTWAEVSARLGRNDMPIALWNAYCEGRLNRVEMAKGLAYAWTVAEWPLRILDEDEWIDMFVSVLTDWDWEFIDVDKIALIDVLPETITLYRGCVEGREVGMSWTSSIETARWFANRFGDTFGPTYVVKYECPRELVIARLDGRGENEYVVDADNVMIEEVKVVE